MPVQIVKKEERLTHKQGGSTFFYRRIPSRQRAAIVRKNTKRGKTDWNAVTAGIIEFVILGWEKVQAEGKDIPFDSEMAMDLPEDVLSEIINLAGGTGEDDDTGGPEKN